MYHVLRYLRGVNLDYRSGAVGNYKGLLRVIFCGELF